MWGPQWDNVEYAGLRLDTNIIGCPAQYFSLLTYIINIISISNMTM
jgi:hypothetical protein